MAVEFAQAQDIIVLDNESAEELEVKVLEVNNNVVTYKKWDYQDGPTFTIDTRDIFVIRYQNGENQRFLNDFSRSNYVARSNRQNPFNNRKDEAFPTFGYAVDVSYWGCIDDYFDEDLIAPIDVTMGCMFNPYIYLGANLSYASSFNGMNFIGISPNFRARYPISKWFAVYGDFSLGAAIGVGDSSGTEFMYRIGPGVELGPVEFSIRYASIADIGFVSLSLGYTLDF